MCCKPMSEAANNAMQVQGCWVSEDRLVDLYRAHPEGHTPWLSITDQVMGGVSRAQLQQSERNGSACTCLTGRTSLENNGGFVQMKLDVGRAQALPHFRGLFLELYGPAHEYDLRVKTTQLEKPWQSFRHRLRVEPRWTRFLVPYADLHAHRTDANLDPALIRSLAVVAIGEAFDVDVCVRRAGFFS